MMLIGFDQFKISRFLLLVDLRAHIANHPVRLRQLVFLDGLRGIGEVPTGDIDQHDAVLLKLTGQCAEVDSVLSVVIQRNECSVKVGGENL